MSHIRLTTCASAALLAGCSVLTGLGDLDFDSADSTVDLGAGEEAGIPDAGNPLDSTRDAGDTSTRDAGPDGGVVADAADMAVVLPCGDCPPIRPCTTPICTADGCSLAELPIGAACDDGIPCTEGTRCDDDGMCVGGSMCPEDGNFCTRAICSAGGCETIPMPNDTSCGPTPDYVCCDGACVNTRVNDGHCGTCGRTCIGSGCIGGMCAAICDTPDVCLPAGAPHCIVASCSRESGCMLGIDATYCFIDGACYSDGSVLGDNPCLTCDVTRSQTAWLPAVSGAPCDDGLACTSDDTCTGDGRCLGVEGCTAGECAVAACSEPMGACSVTLADDGSACAAGMGICCAGLCRDGMGACM